MNAPRMNLFSGVERKEKARARKLKVTSFSPALLAPILVVVAGMFLVMQTNKSHRTQMEALQAELAEVEAQIAETVAMSLQAGAARKPAAAALKPSGMDGSWTAVLWKFAAFTGQRILIREMELAPFPGGGKIQSVSIQGQAGSVVEMRDWLSRLIENMPGSEFSISSQRSTEDPNFPIVFTLKAQVI